jgi:hypothetical protein
MYIPGNFSKQWELAEHNHVRGLWTLGAFLNREFDLLTFFKVLEAVTLDRREVDEDIRAAFASEETITLASVEPFDCTVYAF